MTVADDVEQIGRWARRSDPAERERLLDALADLAATEPLDSSPRAQGIVGDILTALAVGAGPDLRQKLAEWAAAGRCTPHGLAMDLAFDPIDVSGRVIRRSPALTSSDLLRLIAEGAPDHQIAVGRRAALTVVVVEAILDQGEPAALTALANNPEAPLAPEHLELLVGMAQRLPALRAPLARHPGLTPELAQPLRACSGPVVRRMLTARLGDGGPATTEAPAPEGSERRLVAKLQTAGRLTPGYALRVLREGRLSLFEHALAALAGLPPQEVRASLHAESPDALCRTCAGAGLDRRVWPLVLAEVRRLTGGSPAEVLKPVRRTARPRKAAAKPRKKASNGRKAPP